MRDADLPAFQARLDAVSSMLSRGRYVPDAVASAVFFRALQPWPLPAVLAAFDAHVSDPERGRFAPVPADLIAQLQRRATDDGRPGAEEAWATAMRGVDEQETVVWTAEAAEAFGIARPVLAAGDEVGARMAFREAYNRIVEAARRERRPAEWRASEGFDPERRRAVIADAVQRGLLPTSALPALAAPRGTVPLLADETSTDIPADALAGLHALRTWLLRPKPAEMSQDAIERERTAQAKADAARKVDGYGQDSGQGGGQDGAAGQGE